MVESASVTPGRPRDPSLDARIRAAALDLFGVSGWNGLTMEAIARRAGVGKPTLYRRWSDKGALMADALRSVRQSSATDTGSFAGDLARFARDLMDEYRGPHGPALVRYAVEAKFTEDVGREYAVMVRDRIAEATSIVRRGADRGEVLDDTSPYLVISMVHGAVMDFVLFEEQPDPTDTGRRVDAFLERLVSSVVRGFQPSD